MKAKAIILIASILVAGLVYLECYKRKQLVEHRKYTLATIKEFRPGYRRDSPTILYTFFVEGVNYYSSQIADFGFGSIDPNKQYIVAFNPEDPSNNRILLGIKVCKELASELAYDGWATLPVDLKNEEDTLLGWF